MFRPGVSDGGPPDFYFFIHFMGRITDIFRNIPDRVGQRAAGVFRSPFFRIGMLLAVFAAIAAPVFMPALIFGGAALAAYIARPLLPVRFGRFGIPRISLGSLSPSSPAASGSQDNARLSAGIMTGKRQGEERGKSAVSSRSVGNSGTGKASGKVGDPLLKHLIDKLEAMGLQVNTDWDAAKEVFNSLSDKYNFLNLHRKAVCGFVYQGVIHLNPKAKTLQTPIHEYAHVWAEVLRQKNEKEWKKIVAMMKDVRTDEGKKLWSVIKKAYPHLENDDQIADEVLATYSGSHGAELLRQNYNGGDAEAAVRDTLSGVLERFWKAVCALFDYEYTSVDDISEKVLADFLMDVNPLRDAVPGQERMSDRFPQHIIFDVSDEIEENESAYNEKTTMKESENMKPEILTGAVAEQALQEALDSLVSDGNNFSYPARMGTAGFFFDNTGDGSEVVTAFDNSSGDCWVENFQTLKGAERWCRGELSADDVRASESSIDTIILDKDMAMPDGGVLPPDFSFDEDGELLVKMSFHDGYALDINRDDIRPADRLALYYPTVAEVASNAAMQDEIERYTGRRWAEGGEHEKVFDIALKYGRYSSVHCPQNRYDEAVDAVVSRTKDVRAHAFTPEQAAKVELAAACAGYNDALVEQRESFFSSLLTDAQGKMGTVNPKWVDDTRSDLQLLARHDDRAVEEEKVGLRR